MQTNTPSPTLANKSALREFFWPIENHEVKKFLPMTAMMFLILFNYTSLRSIKDGFIVSNIGPEAISFLKTYAVMPYAVAMLIFYSKLCNIMSSERVFYTITTFFVGFFTIFALILYPNAAFFHASPVRIEELSLLYPNFQWFIRILGNWSYALFYINSELWGSVMLSLLFWQFANKITKTDEAKRFYPMFGVFSNLSLPLAGFVLIIFLPESADQKPLLDFMPDNLRFLPIFILNIIAGIVLMWIYKWMHKNVLTDPDLYDPNLAGKAKKKKPKLSISESFKMIISSKYLGLLAVLVLAYGVSINLVEGAWKAAIKQVYVGEVAYARFMGVFNAYQGAVAIIFMLIGGNILRRVSWKAASIFTPAMILITGSIFYSFLIFDQSIGMQLAVFFGTNPIFLAVIIGSMQNVLSKATKYSLFDATKEMAYIPLDSELKSKGKAAVDVVGGRFGKSGGGIIQSTFFMILPTFTFLDAIPYFAIIFFLIVFIWLFAVKALSREYESKLLENNLNEQ